MNKQQKELLKIALSIVSWRNEQLLDRDYKLLGYEVASVGWTNYPTPYQLKERAEEIVYKAIVGEPLVIKDGMYAS